MSSLLELVKGIKDLEQLPYDNLEIEKWENKLLDILSSQSGKESDYHKILHKIEVSFWRPTKGDPRGSASTPWLYQQEYIEYLHACTTVLESMLK